MNDAVPEVAVRFVLLVSLGSCRVLTCVYHAFTFLVCKIRDL